jgi:hypothetical protein
MCVGFALVNLPQITINSVIVIEVLFVSCSDMRSPFLLALMAALAACRSLPAFAEGTSTLVLKYDCERADVLANWHQDLSKESKPDKIIVDTTASHSGQSALKFEITQDAAGQRSVYCGAKVPIQDNKPDRSIRLRLFARMNGVSPGEAGVRVLERDQSKVLGWLEGKETLLPLEPSPDWREYEVLGKLSDSARVVTVFVFLRNPRARQTIWLDDLSLELVQK